jgi:hypothetical protein
MPYTELQSYPEVISALACFILKVGYFAQIALNAVSQLFYDPSNRDSHNTRRR